MPENKHFYTFLRFCGLILLFTVSISAQKIPAPADVLGFTPGDDKKLASWAQTVEYFQKLDAASDRVKFEEIGKTTMGAPFVYATISAPETIKNLDKYKQIQAKLADPRWRMKVSSLPMTIENRLFRDGKTIVLITCGIHSTEVGSHLSSMLIAHRLASSNEPEIQNILRNTIVLLVPSLNPDGVDIVKNWYDKTLGTKFEGTSPPELYHKYTGHDNNRDWYAFTQVETQLTVDKIHNQWHPQIVNDIHQQGTNGARLFVPPYMKPVEPNVPAEIVEGYTELGNYIRDEMTAKGFAGITNDSIYDAWTPARAYSHYHGGVRILTETASARLASPIKVEFEKLRVDQSDNYDPQKASANFPRIWQGGDWTLRDITSYMTTASFTLLKHAADNREAWLKRFYAIGKEAVRPRKKDEPWAYVIKPSKFFGNSSKFYSAENENKNRSMLISALQAAGVEVKYTNKFSLGGKDYEDWTAVIRLDQPYANFAKAMIEPLMYPDLRNEKGQPIPPYDVTAHNLALLTDTKVEKIYQPFTIPKEPIPSGYGAGFNGGNIRPRFLYKSHLPSMDEGWTRWVLDRYKLQIGEMFNRPFEYQSVFDKEIREEGLLGKTNVIIFPDQSPNQMLNGYAKGAMPDEYTGGIGAEGVANLQKFVEAGGTLIFLNRASNFAIEQFNLPVVDVTKGANRKDFYIPGSILRTELDTAHPIAKGMPKESIAWFEDSPAFEIKTDPLALTRNFRVIASYPKNPKDILLSGWALGAERLAGKAALVEFTVGKGKIVLFGFRPQYRGQSLATFPLLFNAISN